MTGTDSNYGPDVLFRISQEIVHFVDMAFSLLGALRAATITGAGMLRMEKSNGVMGSTSEADLLAVEGNLLVNVLALQDPLLGISNGRVALNRRDRPEGTNLDALANPGPGRIVPVSCSKHEN